MNVQTFPCLPRAVRRGWSQLMGRYTVTPGGEHVPLQLILLSDHPTLDPQQFVDEKVVNEHHQDYMFLDCIKFINEVGKWNAPHFDNHHTLLTEGPTGPLLYYMDKITNKKECFKTAVIKVVFNWKVFSTFQPSTLFLFLVQSFCSHSVVQVAIFSGKKSLIIFMINTFMNPVCRFYPGLY